MAMIIYILLNSGEWPFGQQHPYSIGSRLF